MMTIPGNNYYDSWPNCTIMNMSYVASTASAAVYDYTEAYIDGQ